MCINDIDGRCPFLYERKCSVNKIKPLICKAYPFVESKEYISRIREEIPYCLGFSKGKIYNDKEINKLIGQFNREYYAGTKPFIENEFNFEKLYHLQMINIQKVKLDIKDCIIA
jgi:Fe-S-cluster containining protein